MSTDLLSFEHPAVLLFCFVWLRITDEGSLAEMRIWSILLIKSDLNGVYTLVEVSFHICYSGYDYLCKKHSFAGTLLCLQRRRSKFDKNASLTNDFGVIRVNRSIPGVIANLDVNRSNAMESTD